MKDVQELLIVVACVLLVLVVELSVLMKDVQELPVIVVACVELVLVAELRNVLCLVVQPMPVVVLRSVSFISILVPSLAATDKAGL